MIEIQELYKYYGDRRAIGPLSTRIAQGEVVGLLGLNGAGKTTTLRVLACDLLPTSGSVRVAGLDVVERPDDVRAKVGYLPDRPPLYDDMTVREYLGYAARLRNVPKDQLKKRVADVEELTEIGDVANQLIGSLSHGFKQRVGIAQSIVHGPELVVLDEPISGLDPVQIMEMRELVRGLRGAHTVVVSSHILTEISETCDRILVINDGKIAWSGTETELSATLKQGMRIALTLRGPGGSADSAADKARAALTGLAGVREVEVLEPAEQGEGIASLRVAVTSDVREQVGKTLVQAGLGILELTREKELESMFLELLEEGPEQSGRKRRKKKQADADAASAAAAKEPKLMRALTIARREMYAYLRSPLGSAIIAAALLVDGILFYFASLDVKRLSAQLLTQFFYDSSAATMVAGLLLSMRLLAEERQSGTITLLNTAPIRDRDIVLGKFISSFGVLTLMNLLTLYMPLMVYVRGKVSVGHIAVGYLGMILLGSAVTAIGLFASSLARSQVVAVIIGAALVASFILLWVVARAVDPPFNTFFSGLALHHENYRPFMSGTLQFDRVAYYLMVTYFFLLAATKVLEARRWR